ncbi:hypothetical protein [Prosthecochloris sp. HL-130-GSB]|uniref:Uncharacterized protein n=1 Tax=Prosthecochloris aestuarii TaxID=1102 RepID=A0A831WS53_PROAE|nr:hypothetical protein [Prosthecochloris sp. HL-130-GSB]ARM30855.1 hypothetical protein B9H02_05475 [Prosthecochloris sp. HL-130-GSB]HED31315.1 hypothetical protein [Prosthecochloris aestuarii]
MNRYMEEIASNAREIELMTMFLGSVMNDETVDPAVRKRAHEILDVIRHDAIRSWKAATGNRNVQAEMAGEVLFASRGELLN